MFIQFFENLRKSGVPVSLREYLTFLEALSKNLATYEIENFYILGRTIMVKDERHTIGYACGVMKRFKPTLTVIYLSNVDGCHSNFTSYLESLHRADHGVGHIWDYIQNNIPEMANNTTMMVVPEHGRNLNSNNIEDGNAFSGYDHSDGNSRRIFSSIVGPGIDGNLSIGGENNQIGDIVNITPTIAEILGCKNDVVGSGLVASSKSLFDLI